MCRVGSKSNHCFGGGVGCHNAMPLVLRNTAAPIATHQSTPPLPTNHQSKTTYHMQEPPTTTNTPTNTRRIPVVRNSGCAVQRDHPKASRVRSNLNHRSNSSVPKQSTNEQPIVQPQTTATDRKVVAGISSIITITKRHQPPDPPTSRLRCIGGWVARCFEACMDVGLMPRCVRYCQCAQPI